MPAPTFIAILILLLGFAALIGPLTAKAQPARKVPRIGLIGEHSTGHPFLTAFRQGLRELGYIEGESVVIEYRYLHGVPDRAPALVAELIRLNVDVLVIGGAVSALAAKAQTTTVPIVFTTVGNPVGSGLVASLARPGGNATGLSVLVSPELTGKHLELLKTAVPKVSRVTVLYNPVNPITPPALDGAREAARVLAVELQVVEVRQRNELARAFSALTAWRAGAVLAIGDPVFGNELVQLSKLAAKNHLPAIYNRREFADGGDLLAYGPSFSDNWRRSATYVDKILKGAKPADLPVEQPTTLELVINLKTAKAVVAHLHEPAREHMLKKPAHELHDRQGHGAYPMAVRLLIPESHVVVIDAQDAALRDRHLEHVGGEVLQRPAAVTRGLAVDVPLRRPDLARNLPEQAGRVDPITKLGPHDPRQCSHREIEPGPGRMPAPVLVAQRPAHDDIVNVGVILQGASPGVQDPEQPGDVPADGLGVGGQQLDGSRRGREQRPVADLLMPTQEGAQRLGHGEGEHEVLAGQLARAVPLQPFMARALLTARTVAVAAGAMDHVPLPAPVTHVQGRPRGLGMAVGDRSHDALVGLGHGRSEPVEVGRPVRAKELLEEAHGYRPSMTRSITA